MKGKFFLNILKLATCVLAGVFVTKTSLAEMCNLYNVANGWLAGYPTKDYTWNSNSSSPEATVMIKLEEGKKYTIVRVAGSGATYRIQASSTPTLTNGQSLVNIDSSGDENQTTKTITVPNGAPYVLIYIRNTKLNAQTCADGLMVVEGTQAPSSYIPYDANCGVAQTIPVGSCNNLLDINSQYQIVTNEQRSSKNFSLNSGVSVTFDTNTKIATITSTSTIGNSLFNSVQSYTRGNFITGHKYLFAATVRGTNLTDVSITRTVSNEMHTTFVPDVWYRFYSIYTANGGSGDYPVIELRGSAGGTLEIDQKTWTIFDLTAMYGEGNEPTTINNALGALCPIKIATTKYNEDAFANLVTTLNSAITKVTNIVDTTVAQASSIGTLATTKQDRPADGDCPAGRKCLLVTGTDGKPHWYLIQE